MCAGGRIQNHLKALLPDSRTEVLFVGYQAQSTLGRDIQTYGPRGGYVFLDNERIDIRAGVFLVCAVAVAYGIFRPTPPPQFFHQSDKVGHVLALLCVSLTVWLAFRQVRWFYFWPVLFGLAPLLEYLQGELRPLRMYSMDDSYANLAGVAIALLCVTCIRLFKVMERG